MFVVSAVHSSASSTSTASATTVHSPGCSTSVGRNSRRQPVCSRLRLHGALSPPTWTFSSVTVTTAHTSTEGLLVLSNVVLHAAVCTLARQPCHCESEHCHLTTTTSLNNHVIDRHCESTHYHLTTTTSLTTSFVLLRSISKDNSHAIEQPRH